MTLAAGSRPPLAKMPPHNFDKYEFGSGPPVRGTDVSRTVLCRRRSKLAGGYGIDHLPRRCDELRNGAYHVCLHEVGPARNDGETLAQSIENLVKLPLGTKSYLP